MNTIEKQRLESVAENSRYRDGICPDMAMNYCFEIFCRHMRGRDVLELGPAEGVMTALLMKKNFSITVVEGSSVFAKNLTDNFPEIEVFNCLFEDFSSNKKYDNIILGHVLEHVDHPEKILKIISKYLKPSGKILAAVPNARSVHRQAAVAMRLLKQEDELNEMDIHHGHRRVFNPETFRNIFYQSDLKIDVFGGYWLKPLSNRQIDENWTPEMLHAFMQLGERYPDIAGEIYVIASLN